MIRKMLSAAMLVIAISLSVPAKAATYSASFNGTFFDVFAQITTDGLDNVTVITGTVVGVNGGSIGGLAAAGKSFLDLRQQVHCAQSICQQWWDSL